MTCDFTSFHTVFQSYQDDVCVCVCVCVCVDGWGGVENKRLCATELHLRLKTLPFKPDLNPVPLVEKVVGSKSLFMVTVLQIRRGNRDNLGIISHIFP